MKDKKRQRGSTSTGPKRRAQRRPTLNAQSSLPSNNRKQAARAQTLLTEELNRSHQYFRALFNWTPSAVGISTVAEGLLCDVNEGFSRLTGYTREELLGRTTLELGLWADPSQREIVLREIREQGFVHNREGLLRTKSGEIRSLMVTVESIQLGSTPCLIYLGHDITERKRAEEALKQSEERIGSFVRSTDDGIVTLDRLGLILSWNPGAENLFGYAQDEVLGKPMTLLMPERFRERHERGIERASAAGHLTAAGSMFELAGLRKDGTEFPLELSLSSWSTRDEVFFTGIMRDITERKQAEKVLGESEERFRSLVGVITDVPWTADPKGQFVTPQEAYSRYTGASWEELRGHGWAQYIHPDDRERLVRIWKHAVATRTKYEAPSREWHGPTQQWRHVIARGTPVLNPDGSVREWVGSLTDVNEQYEAEAALRESEEKYRTVFNSIDEGFCVVEMLFDQHGKPHDYLFLEINPVFEPLTGLSNAVGKTARELVPGLEEFWIETYWRVTLTGEPARFERYVETMNRWFDVHASRVGDETSRRVAIVFTNITERKQAETLLAAEKNVLELIATGAELPDVLDTLMRETEAQSTDGMLCSVLLADEKGQRLLHGAAPSLPDAYNAAAHGLVIGPSAGSCGTAAFERKPVFVTDIAADQRWAGGKDLAAAHGLAACHSTPILSSKGRLLGTIAMYYRRPHNPSAHDQHLIERATQLAGIVIERKQAEETLRESELRFRRVVGQTTVGVVQADPMGRMTLVNPSWCQMLGYSEAELLQMNIADVTHPVSLPASQEAVRRLAEGGPDFQLEKNYRRKDGSVFMANSSVSALRQSDGDYLGLIAVVLDITDRIRTEEQLRQRDELITLMLNTGPGCIKRVAEDGTVLSMNPAGLRLIDASNEQEAVGRCVFDLVASEHRDAFIAMHRAVLAGQWQTLEFKILGLCGTRRWMQTYAVPLRNPITGSTEQLAVTHDITDRKQTEAALRESEERQRLALSAGKLGSWQLDVATMDLQSSNQCKSDFGRTPEAPFTYEMFRASVHPEDWPMVEQRVAESVRHCGDYEADYRCIWPDGSLHWINAVGRTIGEHGKAARMVGVTRDITKRKRTEEALRLAKFSMDRAADAVYWIDPQAKVLDVNEAASLMLGYSKDELCAMTVHDLNPDFQADMWPGYWAETRNSGPLVFESFHKAKNGRLIPIEVSVNFLSYEGKEYHCAFVRNITERKQAEAALIHSRNLLQSVIQTSPIRVFWKDRESRYLGCNQIFAKDAGETTPEHVIGMMDYDLAWKEQAELYRADDRLVMESGLPKMDFEEPQTTPDGKRIWLRTSKVPLRGEMNQVIGILGIYDDITERKQAEAALRESEDRYRSIFENAVGGIFQTTLDGTYVAVNPALSRIYGYDSPDDMIATITDIATQLYVDIGRRDEFLRLMLAQEEVSGFEALVYRKDGSVIWISESARTLRDQAGTVVGYEGTVEDITERKRAEGRLRVTLDQVRALSGRLATVQEEERARIARELHDELGVKLTCLKIDLSRMMSLVRNRVRADLRAKLNDRVRSMVEQVDSTIVSLQQLVTQLRPALLDDLGLVAAIEWQSRDFQKRTGISCACVSNVDEILMDPERATALFRICQEALTNTARHAQATAVTITVTSQQDSLRLVVADNGVGISDTKLSDRQSLGLRGMLERAAHCGGTVTIEGRPDKGTTITVCLPVGKGQPEP